MTLRLRDATGQNQNSLRMALLWEISLLCGIPFCRPCTTNFRQDEKSFSTFNTAVPSLAFVHSSCSFDRFYCAAACGKDIGEWRNSFTHKLSYVPLKRNVIASQIWILLEWLALVAIRWMGGRVRTLFMASAAQRELALEYFSARRTERVWRI